MNSNITEISFPGLGIESLEVNRVAFTLSFGEKSFSVYWYGIIIVCGILFAFWYAYFRSKNESVLLDDLLDVGIWTVILGVIGARLYYVFTSLDQFVPDPFDFWEFLKNVVNLRSGGLAIYGGVIGGVIGILIVTKIKKINTLKLTDMIAPGVMVAQAIGRWGNFFNAEAHGGIVEEGSPLYLLRMGLRPAGSSADFQYYHPTFLYESVWNLVGFIIINALYKKKKFNGQISCMYLAWYGFGRMFIEGLRTDSLYVGDVRISQAVGLICFVVFGALLVWGLIYSKRFAFEGYEPVGIDRILIPALTDGRVKADNEPLNTSGNEVNEEDTTIAASDDNADEEEENAESTPEDDDTSDSVESDANNEKQDMTDDNAGIEAENPDLDGNENADICREEQNGADDSNINNNEKNSDDESSDKKTE